MIHLDVAALTSRQLVSYYLMASYLYYIKDVSAIPDTTFDQLCKRLLSEFETVDHPHKYLVSELDLEAGTGYRLTDATFPLIVKSAAWQWLRVQQGEPKGG